MASESSGFPTTKGSIARRGWLHWFSSNPWVGVLTTGGTFLGIIVALFLYYAGSKSRQVTYEVNPVRTSILRAGQTTAIKVFFKGQEVSTDIAIAQIAIWNHGEESVRPENVLSPVLIVTRPPVRILEATVRKQSRDVVNLSLDTSRLADGSVAVSWNILEHDDGGVVQLIYAGSPDPGIEVEGTIEGQSRVLHLKSLTNIESPSERLGILEIIGYQLGSVTVLACIFVAVFVFLARKWGVPLGREGKRIIGVSLFLMLLFLIFWRFFLHQPTPPFGF